MKRSALNPGCGNPRLKSVAARQFALGKSFPKKGKSFPKRGGGSDSNFNLDDHAFAMKIAAALRAELKDRN